MTCGETQKILLSSPLNTGWAQRPIRALEPIPHMRHIFVLITFLILISPLSAQELPQFIRERIDFCDSKFSDEQAKQLLEDLNELEDYFIKKRLLKDKSGISYRAVYERIVNENDLSFEIDTTFELLDTLGFQVYTSCFYKALTPEQLSALTLRHQEAAERIANNNEGDITPSIVAQRILDNLTIDDFELEFYRVSSLLTFYRIAYPAPSLDLGLPNLSQNTDTDIETIELVLNKNNQIEIEKNILTLEEAEEKIYQFLLTEPLKKGVEFTPSRDASYESYLELLEMLNSVYDSLKEEFGNIPKNIIFNESK